MRALLHLDLTPQRENHHRSILKFDGIFSGSKPVDGLIKAVPTVVWFVNKRVSVCEQRVGP